MDFVIFFSFLHMISWCRQVRQKTQRREGNTENPRRVPARTDAAVQVNCSHALCRITREFCLLTRGSHAGVPHHVRTVALLLSVSLPPGLLLSLIPLSGKRAVCHDHCGEAGGCEAIFTCAVHVQANVPLLKQPQTSQHPPLSPHTSASLASRRQTRTPPLQHATCADKTS